MNHNALLAWDHNDERHAPGWIVGSTGDDGEHLRDMSGWPYSVYRKGGAPGVSDVCLCHGIQDMDDALELAKRLNSTLAVHRYQNGEAA